MSPTSEDVHVQSFAPAPAVGIQQAKLQLSYSLNSLKAGDRGDYKGEEA